MRKGTVTILALLLISQAILLLALAPAPAGADIDEIVIASDETVVWEDGSQNLTGKVEVFGHLTVRDYELGFDIDNDGEASFWVMEGGVMEFDNVSLLAYEGSAYILIKVEGRFVCHDSEIDHLTGEFLTGGGIKCVDGEVELQNTYIHDCQVQGVYVEGDAGSAIIDGCTITNLQYGVHVKDGGTVTVRNGTVMEEVTRAGVLVNLAGADVSNTTIIGNRTRNTQGIAVRGSQVTIADCVIREIKNEGIELADDASAGIWNCEVFNCTVGVRMSDSSADVSGCTVHDCLDGMNIFQSDPSVRDSRMTGNVNGIASKDCEPGYTLEGCTIGGNSQLGIYAVGKGLSETGTVWTDTEGDPNTNARILQMWVLDVNVSDHEGIPVVGAEVTVRAGDGTRVFNGTTNALGSVLDVELEGHKIDNDGNNVDPGKYQVQIVKGDREATKKITMDKSKVLSVALGKVRDDTGAGLWWLLLFLVIVAGGAAFGYWWIRIR